MGYAARMEAEAEELAAKIEKLEAFMTDSGDVEVTDMQKVLMLQQYNEMNSYLSVLGYRIKIETE